MIILFSASIVSRICYLASNWTSQEWNWHTTDSSRFLSFSLGIQLNYSIYAQWRTTFNVELSWRKELSVLLQNNVQTLKCREKIASKFQPRHTWRTLDTSWQKCGDDCIACDFYYERNIQIKPRDNLKLNKIK